MQDWHWSLLLITMALSIAVLGIGADRLVDEAVTLSVRSGVPRVIVGATVVSLGTTAPEAFVSVLAAIKGNPGLALGNSVGSIICDTGLILGLACLLKPLPFNRQLVNRQGWVQFGAGVLLVLSSLPWSDPLSAFATGGTLTQIRGFAFVVLLFAYMLWSVRQASAMPASAGEDELRNGDESTTAILMRMALSLLAVLASAHVLIAAAIVAAERMGIPEGIIAATVVAFGTSLPELIIVITAVRKNEGELAIGNIIGADILNVLFVAGAAAAVTPAGLHADPVFFRLQFPAMLFVLAVFRVGIFVARDSRLTRPFGAVLLGTYVVYLYLSARYAL